MEYKGWNYERFATLLNYNLQEPLRPVKPLMRPGFAILLDVPVKSENRAKNNVPGFDVCGNSASISKRVIPYPTA
jgi:hypothetical protein